MRLQALMAAAFTLANGGPQAKVSLSYKEAPGLPELRPPGPVTH